jgi:hypothetical protein
MEVDDIIRRLAWAAKISPKMTLSTFGSPFVAISIRFLI